MEQAFICDVGNRILSEAYCSDLDIALAERYGRAVADAFVKALDVLVQPVNRFLPGGVLAVQGGLRPFRDQTFHEHVLDALYAILSYASLITQLAYGSWGEW